MLPNHYGRFYQNSDNSAILKQKLNKFQIQSGQDILACHNKLPGHGFTRIDKILAEIEKRYIKLDTSSFEGGEL